jgi:hypothetical protein
MQSEIYSLNKPYRLVLILLGIVMVFSFMLAGCSKGPPTCDSKKVQKAVIDQHIADLKSQMSAVASAGGQPGMELTEDEWRLFRAGMNFELRNIKQFSFDEAAGILECEADLIVFSSGLEDNLPIEYTAEIVPNTGQVHATIYLLE